MCYIWKNIAYTGCLHFYGNSMATTSFQKKARVKINQIAGTKPSLFNNQLLVSSGVPSLDNIIGKCLKQNTVTIVGLISIRCYER